ncbi:arginine--tRNA ligase [Candidatus Wolfebacteria bacterium]|nr:MAG: arginine--tRNA ligase [Candidatus Wolfebacteria bacterium]
MREKLENLIHDALQNLGIKEPKAILEHPTELSHGDYATNAALMYAKELKMKPQDLAEAIKKHIEDHQPEEVKDIAIAAPGFINFSLTNKFLNSTIETILDKEDSYGASDTLKGKKVMVEYTQPNPFKQFHIGHLMSNTIGESISRIIEFSGADVKRANYQGDVGQHVAKAVWAMLNSKSTLPKDSDDLSIKSKYLGAAYVLGAASYKENDNVKKEIDEINKKIYANNAGDEINQLYKKGLQWSLDHFEEIYKKLGTKFDYYFFEGLSAKEGMNIVDEYLKKGVFEKSEGAVIFKGEEHGLHTRVFITSLGLPTYETKELGNNRNKFAIEPDLDESIVVTAHEQADYFHVLLKVFEFIDKNISEKTKHISHGMMLGPDGKKMASRKGKVIVAESFIDELEKEVFKKMNESDRDFTEEEKDMIAEYVAVGAAKFSILKQQPGKNIVFDISHALSFEGDSGPYLQYSYTRALSLLQKAKEQNISSDTKNIIDDEYVHTVEQYLYRFPEIVARALEDYAPQGIVNYLLELAQKFNTLYAHVTIVDDSPEAPYKVALTKAFSVVMKNGLNLLGIKTPEKM